jgi:hypothetical protein
VDPLITNRLDPTMRVREKQSGEYEPPPRRRRPSPPVKPDAGEESTEPNTHQLDDLA